MIIHRLFFKMNIKTIFFKMIIENQECIQGVGAKGARAPPPSDFEGQGLNGLKALRFATFLHLCQQVCVYRGMYKKLR